MTSYTETPQELRARADKIQTDGEIKSKNAECPFSTRNSARMEADALRGQAALIEKREAEPETEEETAWDARRRRRIERLEDRAQRKRMESAQARGAATRQMNQIPFGQPILVGHHSEGRHRAAIKRMDSSMRKSIDKGDEANELEQRARAAAANTAIDSNDPKASAKLEAKLAGLEARQKSMKDVNAAWRKEKKPAADDTDGWTRVAKRLGMTIGGMSGPRQSMARDFMDRGPYPSYALTNNNANIRRLQGRLKEVERRAETVERPERRIGDVTICDNLEFHKVELHFQGKPDEDTRTLLKRWGFRWVRSVGCWSRTIGTPTESGLAALAEHMGQPLEQLEDTNRE